MKEFLDIFQLEKELVVSSSTCHILSFDSYIMLFVMNDAAKRIYIYEHNPQFNSIRKVLLLNEFYCVESSVVLYLYLSHQWAPGMCKSLTFLALVSG